MEAVAPAGDAPAATLERADTDLSIISGSTLVLGQTPRTVRKAI